MFQIRKHKQAEKRLLTMTKADRIRIAEKIYLLGCDLKNKILDIKKLSGRSGFRLRVGDWRVLFERDDLLKIIYIEKISNRGDIYN